MCTAIECSRSCSVMISPEDNQVRHYFEAQQFEREYRSQCFPSHTLQNAALYRMLMCASFENNVFWTHSNRAFLTEAFARSPWVARSFPGIHRRIHPPYWPRRVEPWRHVLSRRVEPRGSRARGRTLDDDVALPSFRRFVVIINRSFRFFWQWNVTTSNKLNRRKKKTKKLEMFSYYSVLFPNQKNTGSWDCSFRCSTRTLQAYYFFLLEGRQNISLLFCIIIIIIT